MKFNEDSRVKIPTILHLIRLGYDYLSLSGQKWDESTNFFTAIFKSNLLRLNPELSSGVGDRIYDEVAQRLKEYFIKIAA
jgi:type I restriction enzyme R subunit